MIKTTKFPSLKKTLAAVSATCLLGLAANTNAMTLHRGEGGEPGTLDPHHASGTWENAIIGDMFLGLVTEAADGRKVPGAASDWKVSADGKTYTFNLRKDATWSDGRPVTAQDFVFSLRRILDPNTAAKYAYILYPIKNAEALNKAELKGVEQLGVKAIDDYTLQIELENPTPYFIDQLSHYTAFPVPKHVVEKHGKDWVKPGNLVSNGAYVLQEWLPQAHVKSVKNDKFYDAGNVAVDTVFYYPTEDRAAALKRFRAGELDINTDFPTEQYKWLKDNLNDETVVAPYLGTYYYPVNVNNPKLKDVRVRKALSMAINREVITDKVLTTGEVPAYSFVPPGIGNYQIAEMDFKSLSFKDRVKQAQKLMEEAGYSKDNPLELQLRYNTSENHKKVAVAVAAMWKAIYVKTELFNSEVAVHYNELKEGNFDVARAGWIGDYADPQNFLSLLEPTPNNYGGYNDPKFNALMQEAAASQDSDKRLSLMQQAERIAMDDYATIPIYYYVSKNLVSSKVKGWQPNVVDIHRTRWMSVER